MCSQTQKRFRSYSYKPFPIECAGYKQKITNHIIDFASHTISIEPYWGRPLCIVHTCQLYFFSALFPPPSHLLRCNRLSIWYNSIDFSAGKCVYSINLNARIAIYFIENNSNKLFVALFKPDLFFCLCIQFEASTTLLFPQPSSLWWEIENILIYMSIGHSFCVYVSVSLQLPVVGLFNAKNWLRWLKAGCELFIQNDSTLPYFVISERIQVVCCTFIETHCSDRCIKC